MLVDVLVLHIEFRQWLDVVELELLANSRLLRVLIGDAPRRGYDSDKSSGCPLTQPRTVDHKCNDGTGGGCIGGAV